MPPTCTYPRHGCHYPSIPGLQLHWSAESHDCADRSSHRAGLVSSWYRRLAFASNGGCTWKPFQPCPPWTEFAHVRAISRRQIHMMAAIRPRRRRPRGGPRWRLSWGGGEEGLWTCLGARIENRLSRQEIAVDPKCELQKGDRYTRGNRRGVIIR